MNDTAGRRLRSFAEQLAGEPAERFVNEFVAIARGYQVLAQRREARATPAQIRKALQALEGNARSLATELGRIDAARAANWVADEAPRAATDGQAETARGVADLVQIAAAEHPDLGGLTVQELQGALEYFARITGRAAELAGDGRGAPNRDHRFVTMNALEALFRKHDRAISDAQLFDCLREIARAAGDVLEGGDAIKKLIQRWRREVKAPPGDHAR